mmetsp:Transcript_47872/g.113769  ORF Transcript_47872/g.113769 Transcript_47872/m.113769 type:complete len:163 (+) Transcript_47872:69-557(+)
MMQRLCCEGTRQISLSLRARCVRSAQPALQRWSLPTLPLSMSSTLGAGRGNRFLQTSPRRCPAAVVCLPEGVECEIGLVKSVLCSPGKTVEFGDVVAEIEVGPNTILEIQATHTGEVTRILRKAGDRVRRGEGLVELQVKLVDFAKGWWNALAVDRDASSNK